MFNAIFSIRFFSIVTAEYIIQCHRSDPKLLDCLKGSLHHLRPYLAQGIPEIEVCRSNVFIPFHFFRIMLKCSFFSSL